MSRGAAAAETATTGGLRTGLIHTEAAPTDLTLVQISDGGFRPLVGTHFDERKSARTAGRLVAHDPDRVHRRDAREELLQFGLSDLVRQISNVKLPHRSTPSAAIEARSIAPANAGALDLDMVDSWAELQEDRVKVTRNAEAAEYAAKSRLMLAQRVSRKRRMRLDDFGIVANGIPCCQRMRRALL